MPRKAQMSDLFTVYAAKIGRDASDLRFQLHGHGEKSDLDPNGTAHSLDLKENDQIDCFISQPDKMEIFIKTLTGLNFTLMVRAPTRLIVSRMLSGRRKTFLLTCKVSFLLADR